jgi:hypothetical protein
VLIKPAGYKFPTNIPLTREVPTGVPHQVAIKDRPGLLWGSYSTVVGHQIAVAYCRETKTLLYWNGSMDYLAPDEAPHIDYHFLNLKQSEALSMRALNSLRSNRAIARAKAA